MEKTRITPPASRINGPLTVCRANPRFFAHRDGKPVFLVDRLLGKKDLDFPDLFATRPEVAKRGIGLQREAFKAFHFSTGKTAQ